MNYINKPYILFGGDYNPDQWDEETIHKDMELFKKAKVNTLTLPVFSWAKLEPEEGKYSFEWLDNVLKIIEKNGISYILATPTCVQPAWMSIKYPEVLPVDIAGRKRTHGMRTFFCVNSSKYRERAAAIAKAMADRYSKYPGLIGWHVANEYGTYCYCETCQNKFRLWLKNRYHSIKELNNKWNTSFWGKTIYHFDEVMLPTELNDDYRFNPILQLDYMRFVTDSTIECYENEAAILKKATPEIPTFTNISGFIKKINQFKMVEAMDLAGWDNYPSPTDERSFPALKHDIMRACKDGKSYYVMEQSPNQQNWQPYNKLKRPGEVRKLAYQGLAHGADSSLFFQMRQSVSGQEKFHGALISHNGRDDTRIFGEMKQLGREFNKLGNRFIGAETKSSVGIIFDWDNWWALELASGPSKDINYLEEVHYYYKPFYYKNISVDIIKTTSSLSNYKVIVAPMLYMLNNHIAEKLETFVKEGGTLIATYMTGYVDENDRCVYGAYPGKLRDTMGIYVEETDALMPTENNSVHIVGSENGTQRHYKSEFLCDLIHTETATPLALYDQDFYEGMPAVTVNSYGKGKAYYIATRIEDKFLKKLYEKICSENQIEAVFDTYGDIEVTVRENKSCKTWFVINHGSEEGVIDLRDSVFINLLTETEITGKINVVASDVMILTKK